MSEKHLPPLDLTRSALQVADRWRKWKCTFEYYTEGRTSTMFVRRHLNFYISPVWKCRTYSKTYKILVPSQRRAITRRRSLFASWIPTFVSRRIFLMSTMFFVSCHYRRGRPLTSLWYAYENKLGVAI